jgi:hypothetical protein
MHKTKSILRTMVTLVVVLDATLGMDVQKRDKAMEQQRTQWTEARKEAEAKYIAAAACSVSNSSTPEELERFPRSLGIDASHAS